MKANELILFRHRIGNPCPSHGGPAASIAWSLFLNGVKLASESDRVLWADRNKRREPNWAIISLARALEEALSIKAIRVTEKEFNAYKPQERVA